MAIIHRHHDQTDPTSLQNRMPAPIGAAGHALTRSSQATSRKGPPNAKLDHSAHRHSHRHRARGHGDFIRQDFRLTTDPSLAKPLKSAKIGKYRGQKSEKEQPGSQKTKTKQEDDAYRQVAFSGAAFGT